MVFPLGYVDDVVEDIFAYLFDCFLAGDYGASVDVDDAGIFFASFVLEATFTTGAIGLPVGVPRPVVKSMMLAPAPASAVVLSTSLPGVHNKLSPGFVTYSV